MNTRSLTARGRRFVINRSYYSWLPVLLFVIISVAIGFRLKTHVDNHFSPASVKSCIERKLEKDENYKKISEELEKKSVAGDGVSYFHPELWEIESKIENECWQTYGRGEKPRGDQETEEKWAFIASVAIFIYLLLTYLLGHFIFRFWALRKNLLGFWWHRLALIVVSLSAVVGVSLVLLDFELPTFSSFLIHYNGLDFPSDIKKWLLDMILTAPLIFPGISLAVIALYLIILFIVFGKIPK